MTDERRRREEAARRGSGWSPAGVALSLLLHALAIGLIFVAPHPIQPAPPTAYTVELVDPSALGGKLLAGPIGGGAARPAPPPPPKEPPPPPPPPPPEPPPPEQIAKNEPPPPPPPEDEDDEAMPLGTAQPTPVLTVTPRLIATARPTAEPTARPTMRPTARSTATMIASPKPKATATPYIVVAKNASPAPAATAHRPSAAPTPGAEVRPKATPNAAADDLDGKLAAAIKGVEAKVEKSGGGRGVPGAPGTGGGQGGTERTLDGPAGVGGEGRGGGGTVRGLEFVVYYNQMLNRIKERWTWVGTRADLRVTVQFSILPSGEITNIRLVERSGDQSYDTSVERAVRGAGPMPPPPEAYRTDFGSVELTFRPADLQRPPG